MHFTVIGGDLRSVYLCRRLLRDRHKVHSFGLELADIPSITQSPDLYSALAGTQCVVLPIPTADGILLRAPYSCTPIPLAEVADALPNNVPVFGSSCAIPLTDITRNEGFAIGNAALTAQCAPQLLTEHSRRSLVGESVLILGGGRIGTLLALQLKNAGASVTVAARCPTQRARCKALGADALDLRKLPSCLPRCHTVVNTIPAPVLTRELLALLPKDALLLELASHPGGYDPQTAQVLGLTHINGSGLPGRLLPNSAGNLIADTIYEALEM